MAIVGKRAFVANGIFGFTGHGKSYQTDKEITFYNSATQFKSARKALIFDTNGEYLKYPTISIKDIPQFTKPICCRINAKNWDREQKVENLGKVIHVYRNGLFVVDDPDKFMVWSQDQDLISLFMGKRHFGIDLSIVHQSLEMATQNFWRNASTIRLHYQISKSETLKSKAEVHCEILQIAENIIKNQYYAGNERFFLTIHLLKRKIFGCSNKDKAIDAGYEKNYINGCKEYISKNPHLIKDETARLVAFNQVSPKEAKSQVAYNLAQENVLNRLKNYRDTTGTMLSLY